MKLIVNFQTSTCLGNAHHGLHKADRVYGMKQCASYSFIIFNNKKKKLNHPLSIVVSALRISPELSHRAVATTENLNRTAATHNEGNNQPYLFTCPFHFNFLCFYNTMLSNVVHIIHRYIMVPVIIIAFSFPGILLPNVIECNMYTESPLFMRNASIVYNIVTWTVRDCPIHQFDILVNFLLITCA